MCMYCVKDINKIKKYVYLECKNTIKMTRLRGVVFIILTLTNSLDYTFVEISD